MAKLIQSYLQGAATFPLSRMPLWAILVIPFTTIIITVVALTGYLSHRSSQSAINDMAAQLVREINHRVDAHLELFLEIPNLINQTNANIIQHQSLDISDSDAVGYYLWDEIQVYESVSSIYLGNPQGGLISGGREGADGSLYLIMTDNFSQGPLNKYATDSAGHPTDLLVHVPAFDARLRPWYIGAVGRGDAYWTPPYVLSTGQDLAIASSLPIYADNGDLIAVAGVDLFISDISHFLQEIEIGKTGQAYIVEQSGLLVATSTGAAPFVKGTDVSWERLSAADSSDTLIATSANYILEELGGFPRVADQQQHVIDIHGKPHYLWVTPYHDARGLDWYVVIAIPESDFLGQIEAQNRVTLLLTAMAVIMAVIMGILTALQVSRPLARLSNFATDLAQEKWSEALPAEGVQEIRQLGEAFNTMAVRLQQAFSHLEERVHERTAALETSQARYRAIVDDQTELICRFLPDNTLTFVNNAYCRYFDTTADKLIGTNFIPRLPDSDQAQLEQEMASLNLEHSMVIVEHRVIKPDGQIRWLQWVNRALFDGTGNVIEIQAVGRDITERKQFEEALKNALAKETELNELKSQFISTVSHEFRTPLAIILSSSEIIQHYSDRIEPERRQEHLRRIRSQVERMTHLLEDLLTINKADRGKLEFKPESVDLVTLCQTVINEIRVTTGKGISFNFSFTGNCSEMLVDEKLVRLIVTNLVSNAAKYSASDSTVSVVLDCSTTKILLTVKDEGIGIPIHVQPHIFEPFYRADNVSSIAGSGLGLAIVKQSVEQHSGTISFESEPGKGTIFTVTLPNSVGA